MRLYIDIPTLQTDEIHIGESRLGSGQQDYIHAGWNGIAGTHHMNCHAGFGQQRIKIIKIRNARKDRNGNIYVAKSSRP